jgi:ATP-binding cassette subfamily B (MDR/TAP) protein 10
LALVGMSIVPPVAAFGVWMGKKVKKISKELQDTLAASTEHAEEKLSNIRTVRAFAMEDKEVERYGDKIKLVQEKAAIDALLQAKFYGATGLSGNMIILTVLYYGGNLVTSDVLTVGNLASFVLYSAYVGIGLSGVSTFYAEMMKGLGASTRLWNLIDRQPSIKIEDGITPTSQPVGHINFSNVHFSYPTRQDIPVLSGLDLEIEPNTVVAVVGASGSGKSTVGSLLLRLYDPDQGSITLDGVDIKDLNPCYLRRCIGTVSQEPTLFSASIRENITYGVQRPELVSQEALEEAAKEANAHDFISKFPEGYDTMVGERGVLLSGGQKQRVAIARYISMSFWRI